MINQIWNSPFINYKTSFLLSDNIISLDFSPSNDLLLLLTKDNNINFLNTTHEKMFQIDQESNEAIEYSAVKFLDDYNFITSTKNGIISVKNIK